MNHFPENVYAETNRALAKKQTETQVNAQHNSDLKDDFQQVLEENTNAAGPVGPTLKILSE